MKILLDEQVPEPALEPLRFMLPTHRIDHVQRIRWKGKQDLQLIPDMVRRGYVVLVTADVGQLEDYEECTAIKKAGNTSRPVRAPWQGNTDDRERDRDRSCWPSARNPSA